MVHQHFFDRSQPFVHCQKAMVALKDKTEEQLAKERALLSKIQLCNCHTLALTEMYGDWSKVWQEGKVDMHCWHSYHPDVSGSLLLAIPIRKEVVAESHS